MIREYVVKVTDTFLPGAFQRFESEWAPEQELIRCKDCKHGEECVKPHKDYWCHLHDAYQYGDWFCADGERRDADA